MAGEGRPYGKVSAGPPLVPEDPGPPTAGGDWFPLHVRQLGSALTSERGSSRLNGSFLVYLPPLSSRAPEFHSQRFIPLDQVLCVAKIQIPWGVEGSHQPLSAEYGCICPTNAFMDTTHQSTQQQNSYSGGGIVPQQATALVRNSEQTRWDVPSGSISRGNGEETGIDLEMRQSPGGRSLGKACRHLGAARAHRKTRGFRNKDGSTTGPVTALVVGPPGMRHEDKAFPRAWECLGWLPRGLLRQLGSA